MSVEHRAGPGEDWLDREDGYHPAGARFDLETSISPSMIKNRGGIFTVRPWTGASVHLEELYVIAEGVPL